VWQKIRVILNPGTGINKFFAVDNYFMVFVPYFPVIGIEEKVAVFVANRRTNFSFATEFNQLGFSRIKIQLQTVVYEPHICFVLGNARNSGNRQ
jgi:hypothetical protein